MRDNALVTAVTPESILVTPLLTDTCINCAESSCAKRGTPFPVDNPRALAVKRGDVVSVAAKKGAAITQAFFSLLFPVSLAAAGFFFAPFIAGLSKGSLPLESRFQLEGLKAVLVLAGLALGAGIVMAANRMAAKQTRAEIVAVIT
jgi:hypothetical protein